MITRARPLRAAVPTVGVLTDHAPLAAIFAQGLIDAAWNVGHDVTVLRRGAGPDAWRGAVRELTALPATVIVAGDHGAARAAHAATDVIPIVVIDFEYDPIASGFVRTLTHPGGNVTGVFCDFDATMRQLARALLDAVPTRRPLVALTDGEATEAQAQALRDAGVALGVDVETIAIGADPPDPLVDRVAGGRGALLVLASPRLAAGAARVAKRAARHKLPSAGAFVRYAHVGGLLARGPSAPDAFRRAAATVNRLLHGARADELAVERPPRFELVLNARTATALDVVLPPSLLATADHVIR
jgi:putative ABC transport system substrate-binding protein